MRAEGVDGGAVVKTSQGMSFAFGRNHTGRNIKLNETSSLPQWRHSQKIVSVSRKPRRTKLLAASTFGWVYKVEKKVLIAPKANNLNYTTKTYCDTLKVDLVTFTPKPL